LSDILDASGIIRTYHHVENRDELEMRIEEFNNSNCRYLHISCHANDTCIRLTNECLTNEEFASILQGKLNHKRLFLSACGASNLDLASLIIRDGAYSLVGSPETIRSEKAALLWASFFQAVQRGDQNVMKKKDIKIVLEQCVDLFGIPIDYYSYIKADWQGKIRKNVIRFEETTESIVIDC
jgi:hypothetical protein